MIRHRDDWDWTTRLFGHHNDSECNWAFTKRLAQPCGATRPTATPAQLRQSLPACRAFFLVRTNSQMVRPGNKSLLPCKCVVDAHINGRHRVLMSSMAVHARCPFGHAGGPAGQVGLPLRLGFGRTQELGSDVEEESNPLGRIPAVAPVVVLVVIVLIQTAVAIAVSVKEAAEKVIDLVNGGFSKDPGLVDRLEMAILEAPAHFGVQDFGRVPELIVPLSTDGNTRARCAWWGGLWLLVTI